MKPSLVMGFLVFIVVGCAGKTHWVKPGITEGEARRDNYECTKEASYPATFGVPGHKGGTIMATRLKVDRELYDLCMQGRGYTEKAD